MSTGSPNNGIYEKVPNSILCVAPFLEEAQSILLANKSESNFAQLRVAILCIDHAFKLLNLFALKLDEEARKILLSFKAHREHIVKLLSKNEFTQSNSYRRPVGVGSDSLRSNTSLRDTPALKYKVGAKTPAAEDALTAEASATLDLAEEQWEAGMTKAAAHNFHTASVYFQVLQSFVPHMSAEIKGRMQYASCRMQQCSHLLDNLVRVNFEGRIFADHYEMVGGGQGGRLGEGSYGMVHLCKCRKTGDSFACKVIGLNRVNSHYLRKLHSEIAIMKEVDHPHIIRIREVFFGSRTVYLVMELCQGGELFSHLTVDFKKGFPEMHAALLMRDMLTSVKYLHKRGIVHRDIKLENFLFEYKTPDSRLKLIDFGLSKYCNPETSMYQVVGSAYYTAPEVLHGEYDYRCDIWSLGIVAYMLVSGAPPFYGDSNEKINAMTLSTEAKFPTKRFGHISESCVDFIKELLTKDPEVRISLDDALKHPYIKSADNFVIPGTAPTPRRRNSLIPPPSHDLVHSLSDFIQSSRVQKVILKAVACSLTPTQMSDLADEFFSIDKERNGVISVGDLQRSMVQLINEGSGKDKNGGVINGPITSSPSFEQLAQYSDVQVNFIEFIAAAMCKRIEIDEDRILAAFHLLDHNGTGLLDTESIRRVLGVDASEENINQIMNELDTNNNGKIDYQDFSIYWRKLQIEKRVKAIGQFRKAVNSISAALNVVNQFKEASVSSVMRLPSLIMRVNTNTPVLNSHREEQSLHKSASTVQKSPSAVKLPPLSNKMVTPRRTVTTDVNDPQSMGRKDWTANFIAAKTENMESKPEDPN